MSDFFSDERQVKKAINLSEKFAAFDELWTPKIVGELNGQYVKLAKGLGEMPWHAHADEDEFFIDDLVGMTAVSEDGAPLGEVVAMHDFGGGDVLELRPRGGGRTQLYPFTRKVAPEIDLDARRLTLVPPGEIVARPEEDDTP